MLSAGVNFYLQRNGQVHFPDNAWSILPMAMPPNSDVDLIDCLRHGLTDPRVADGTFPTAAGVLRTLGTRRGGALAAYDHGELGCGLLPETSDFSAVIAEPGSFYFLVGAVGRRPRSRRPSSRWRP